MLKQDSDLYEFGPFRLITSERLLLREGVRVQLTEKAFDTLAVLVQRTGRLVAKEDLIAEVWPDSFVEDNNLEKSISAVRQALGEKGPAFQYIETVRGHGYRFAAAVTAVTRADAVRTGEQFSRSTLGDAQPPADGSWSAAAPAARRGSARSLFWFWIAAAATLDVSLAAYVWHADLTKRVEKTAGPRSVAVLPFTPLASGARDEPLELGMADTLITKLGALSGVTVRPVTAVRQYTSLERDPVAAGRALRVETVLDGSIQRAGDRVRVTVRLTRVSDGVSLWTGTFDEKLADIFGLQDSISGQVTRALAARLNGSQSSQLAKHDTESEEAYYLYLNGRYFWNKRTEDATRRSIDYFRHAVALDAHYAHAYSGLADAYWILHFLSDAENARDLPSLAKAAALKAIALDETLAEAHTSLGEINQTFDLDFASAEREFRRAIALNPNYVSAHQRYGFFLTMMGRTDEARAEFGRALDIDPLSPVLNADAGRPFFRLRDYDGAAARFRKAIELDPNFPRAHILLALCYTHMGRYDEAVSEARKGAALSDPSREPLSYQMTYILAMAGRVREARRILRDLEQSPIQRNDQLYHHALTYAALGDDERAFALIQQLYETRSVDLLALKTDPAWDRLRNAPRFLELLQRFGIVP
jgi:DNA-binding winged helix-turn-helix (wHTH) protein/TolB-like protein/Flp pilus assembly protein TadD